MFANVWFQQLFDSATIIMVWLYQWFISTHTQEAVKATDSRYDGQVAVFGGDFQKRLEHLKYFVVSTPLIYWLVY